jgi:hypothetical protein
MLASPRLFLFCRRSCTRFHSTTSSVPIFHYVCTNDPFLGGITVYQLQGESAEGDVRYFRKPWLTTSLMFVAMSVCLPIAWVVDWYMKRHHPVQHTLDEGHQPLLQTLAPNDPHSATTDKIENKRRRSVFLLAIPMALDLVATLLMSIGLLYVTASVYQASPDLRRLWLPLFDPQY